jgi:hypothetical protein
MGRGFSPAAFRKKEISKMSERVGSVGCRFDVKSLHWSSDEHLSAPSLDC